MKVAFSVDDGSGGAWARRLDLAAAGVEPVFLGFGEAGPAGPVGHPLRGRPHGDLLLPDFPQLVSALDDSGAEACFVAGGGPLALLGGAAARLTHRPLVTLLDSLDHVPGPGPPRGSRPDLFLLAGDDLLERALDDPRYGSTLVPVGNPALDPELGGDGDTAGVHRGAGARLVGFLDRWRRDALEAGEPELSVIVPAYNEEGNIVVVCDRLLAALAEVSAEILVVDDGSRDATFARARGQMWRSPRIRAYSKPAPRGMGNGIRFGIERARARYLAVTMGDGSDEVARLPEMLARVRDDGCSLAIGSRYRHRRNYRSVPLLYRFWSACFRLVARLLIGFRLSDYTNAFRVFDREIFRRYGPESGGFEISPEITFKAWFTNRRIAEVDVCHLKRASGQSSFSFLRAGPGYVKIVVKAFVQRLTGRWFVLDW